MRLNQAGSALLNVIVASLVIGGISSVIMQQASQSQGYSRLARVKSAMFAAETQMRSLVLEPSSYTGCNGTDFRTCHFNAPLITNFRAAVTGAKCAAAGGQSGGGGCGVVVRARPGFPLFNSATRSFNAVIHYEGEELSLRDIEIQNLIVPYETLIRSAAICPNATPIFRGMQDGLPICEALNSSCGPRQWVTNIDPATLAVTCANYPPSINCAANSYISNISYTAAGLVASCSPRADIWAFNQFTPSITTSGPIVLVPPKPVPTNPGVKVVNQFISVNSDCYPTLAQCEATAGAGNCGTSATSVFRATGGNGGGSYLAKSCDINFPGSLRDKTCSPTGSTTYLWDACIYDGYGKVDWDQPYLSTNYECRVKEYCPIAVPTTTTTPPTCVYSCQSGSAECSPGPAAGCSYASYRTATGQPNRVGQSCSTRLSFQRTGGGVTCDVGWVDCDCTAAPTTTSPPTTVPPTPPTSPPPGSCVTGVNTGGMPTVRWLIVCAANNGNNGSPRPDFNVLKAGTPAGGTRSFGNFGASGSNSGWNCLASNSGTGNLQVSGSRSNYNTYGYVYGEVEWGGTVYSGWSGEQTSNADQCDMRGNGGRWGDCTLGVGGSLPDGLAVGQMVNMPSTVHGYFSSYACPPPPPSGGSCPDECPQYEQGGICTSSPVQGGCRVFCSGSGTIFYRCR